MINLNSMPKSTQEALADLAEARDAARVRLHLLSMEAHQRWQKLEATLEELENKLSDQHCTARESVLKATREATQAVKELLQRSHAGAAKASRDKV